MPGTHLSRSPTNAASAQTRFYQSQHQKSAWGHFAPVTTPQCAQVVLLPVATPGICASRHPTSHNAKDLGKSVFYQLQCRASAQACFYQLQCRASAQTCFCQLQLPQIYLDAFLPIVTTPQMNTDRAWTSYFAFPPPNIEDQTP